MNTWLRDKIKENYPSQIAFATDIGEHDSLVSKVVRGWRGVPEERKLVWARALKCRTIRNIRGIEMSDYKIILESLERQYPGRLLVGVREIAIIFDQSPKTIYNQTCRKAVKKFPVMPVSGPGKKFRLTDIAKALARM